MTTMTSSISGSPIRLLYELIDRGASSLQPNMKLGLGWAQLLNLDSSLGNSDEREVQYRCLYLAQDLLGQAQAEFEQLDESAKLNFSDALTNIRPPFFPNSLLHDWSEFLSTAWSSASRKDMKHLSFTAMRYLSSDNTLLDKDVITDLRSGVSELVVIVQQAQDLPEELRLFILESLARIDFALTNHFTLGKGVLRSSLGTAMAGFLMVPSDQRSLIASTDSGHRFWTIISRIADLIAVSGGIMHLLTASSQFLPGGPR